MRVFYEVVIDPWQNRLNNVFAYFVFISLKPALESKERSDDVKLFASSDLLVIVASFDTAVRKSCSPSPLRLCCRPAN